jgi:hypothetical protein
VPEAVEHERVLSQSRYRHGSPLVLWRSRIRDAA